jgi:hypothetical protein
MTNVTLTAFVPMNVQRGLSVDLTPSQAFGFSPALFVPFHIVHIGLPDSAPRVGGFILVQAAHARAESRRQPSHWASHLVTPGQSWPLAAQA